MDETIVGRSLGTVVEVMGSDDSVEADTVDVAKEDERDSEEVIADDELELTSSGQMPVVHGSVEQHPRKSPFEQTYHCLPPKQVLIWRANNSSSMLDENNSSDR